MSVWPGVLLCVLAPHPACIRYKVRHARLVGGENGRKFAMHGLLVAKTVESSPCARKTRQIGPFWASRASFVPGVGPCDLCWASFVPGVGPCDSCWASFVPGVGPCDLCWASFVPGVGLCDSCWASFVSPWHLPCLLLPGFRRPRALRTGPAGFGMASMLVIEGVLQH